MRTIVETEDLRVEQSETGGKLMIIRIGDKYPIAALLITFAELNLIADAAGLLIRASNIVNDFMENPKVKADKEVK